MMAPRDIDSGQARTELYDIMGRDLSFEEKARQALELGEAHLGVENGHLARIDVGADFWEAIVSTDPEDGEYPPGLILDYQDTYCRMVVEKDDTLAIHDAPNQGLAEDPAYRKHGLKTYHGTPITVDGELFGTICFVDSDSRSEPFSDRERSFAELIARMLEHELKITRRQQELDLATGINTALSRVLRHNIRNDLNVIQGALSELHEKSGEGDGLYASAQHRMDDLLQLAAKARQIESIAHSKIDRRPVELTRLVQSIIEDLRTDYPNASFSINSHGDIRLKAIPTLRQGLRELIENAAKHAGEDAEVDVTIRETPEGIELEIKDNGPGLPDQELKVLDAGTETPLIHGSGLGLWLTYLVISEHEGNIEPVVTKAGTTVTITLPRADTPPDITDSDRMLRMFHREQDRFEAVFEHAFDAIVISDDEGRYIEVNPSATDLFGKSRRELLGRHIDEFAPDGFDFETTWREFRQSDRDRDEFPLVRPDGSKRIVEYGATPEIIPGEHLSILRDITERRERERRFNVIFDKMYQFTGLLDAEGRILEANESALEFGGLESAEVIGEPMWETYWFQSAPETRQKAKSAVERAMEGETVQEVLIVQGRHDDLRIDFSVRPVIGEDGELEYIVAEGRDISHFNGANGSAGAVT